MEAQSLPTAEKFIAKASALKFMGNVFGMKQICFLWISVIMVTVIAACHCVTL